MSVTVTTEGQGAAGPSWVEARDDAQRAAMHRTGPHGSRAEAENASLATLALSSVSVSLGVTERRPAVTCRGGESVSFRRTDRAFGPILAAATALKNGRFVHRTGHQLK